MSSELKSSFFAENEELDKCQFKYFIKAGRRRRMKYDSSIDNDTDFL